MVLTVKKYEPIGSTIIARVKPKSFMMTDLKQSVTWRTCGRDIRGNGRSDAGGGIVLECILERRLFAGAT